MSEPLKFGEYLDEEMSRWDREGEPYTVEDKPVISHSPEYLVLEGDVPEHMLFVNLRTVEAVSVKVG